MDIMFISVINDGYVHCKSNFYSAHTILSNENYSFGIGVNKLIGEIDSNAWAISYLLSMYRQNQKDFVLFSSPEVRVNDEVVPLLEFMEYTCYLDKSYSLFKSNNTIKKLVSRSIKSKNIDVSPNYVRDMFHIDKDRFERPLSEVGNEIFKAMAAIAYVSGKQVFCFPWLSQMRFDSYHKHMTDLLEILESLNKIVILPMGKTQDSSVS